jgi:ACS family hexuronate transporter-like MFS transporter
MAIAPQQGAAATAGGPGVSSGTRYTIVGLLSASIAINLIDRQVLSVLSRDLIQSMGWTAQQYSYVTSAFQVGMMLGQVPIGVFMDRVGARIGLAAILVAWSVIGGAHALAGSLAGFMVLRVLMGMAQCGNYTAGIKVLAGLFAAANRSSAGGLFNAGAQLGGLLALPIVAFIFSRMGLTVTFVVPALLGLLWLGPWLTIVPKAPPPTTMAAGAGVPASALTLGQLISNNKVLALFLVRVFSGPITTFYWAWLPLYLRTERDMSLAMVGLIGWLPNLFGMTGNIVGGFLTDWLVKTTGSVDRGRKLAFTGAFSLGALSMAMPFVPNDYLALTLMGLALFGNQWVAATYIGTVGDVVPQELAGRVNGLAGFGDSSSVLVAQLVIGVLVTRYSFTPVFVAAGVFPLLALISVLFVMGPIERATFK